MTKHSDIELNIRWYEILFLFVVLVIVFVGAYYFFGYKHPKMNATKETDLNTICGRFSAQEQIEARKQIIDGIINSYYEYNTTVFSFCDDIDNPQWRCIDLEVIRADIYSVVKK